MAHKEKLRVDVYQKMYQLISDKQGPIEETNRFLWALKTRGLSSLTIRAYAYDLLAIYRWMSEKGYSLKELTQALLLDFIRHEQQRDAHPSSINRRLTVCRLLHNFYYPKGLATTAGTSLPAPYYRGPGRDQRLGIHVLHKKHKRVLRVKTPQKQITPLSTKQIREYLRSLRRYRDIGIVHLMLLCGLRSHEVLQLKCRDVSLVERRVRVMGKGSKERIVPLADLAATSIEQYLIYEKPHGYADETLFVCLQGKHRGRAMTKEGLRSIFRSHRKRTGLAEANPHRFRHTFGTDMARAGMSLSALQKIMGHANFAMSLHYINLSMRDVADAYRIASEEIHKLYDIE